MRTLCLFIAATLAAFACQEDAPEDRREALGELFKGEFSDAEVVATVNGRAISAAALARQVALQERPAREVLDDLIMAEILADRALAEGYGDSDALQREKRRFTVQRYLQETVEKPNDPKTISKKDVRAYYDEHKLFYFRPELRSARHLLIKASSKKWPQDKRDTIPPAVLDEAHQAAVDLRAQIDKGELTFEKPGDLDEILAVVSKTLSENLEAKVEDLPDFPKRQYAEPGHPMFLPAMVGPFADAAFEAKVGELVGPVKTVFGSHVLVVVAIDPEKSQTFESAEAGIRGHLSKVRSEARFSELLAEAIENSEATVFPGMLGLLGSGQEGEP